jgi:hypothetical protein
VIDGVAYRMPFTRLIPCAITAPRTRPPRPYYHGLPNCRAVGAMHRGLPVDMNDHSECPPSARPRSIRHLRVQSLTCHRSLTSEKRSPQAAVTGWPSSSTDFRISIYSSKRRSRFEHPARAARGVSWALGRRIQLDHIACGPYPRPSPARERDEAIILAVLDAVGFVAAAALLADHG